MNDDFGHERGDEVLVGFAGILNSALRESDSCYRWGGEEFVAVLKDITMDEAQTIAERLRIMVEKTDFGLHRPMTVSIDLTDPSSCPDMLETALMNHYVIPLRLLDSPYGHTERLMLGAYESTADALALVEVLHRLDFRTDVIRR